jgi:hypothetical protein
VRAIFDFVNDNKAIANRLDLHSLLGCGRFGCVFDTSDPLLVTKITRDKSEYEITTKIIELQKKYPDEMKGFSKFEKTESLPLEVEIYGIKWKLYAITRENIKPNPVKRNRLVGLYLDLSRRYPLAAKHEQKIISKRIVEILEELKLDTKFENIVNSLVFVFEKIGIWLGDVHEGNIGESSPNSLYNPQSLVIFDAGYTVLGGEDIIEPYFDTNKFLHYVNKVTKDEKEKLADEIVEEYLAILSNEDIDFYEYVEDVDISDEIAEDITVVTYGLPSGRYLPNYPTTELHLEIFESYLELLSKTDPQLLMQTFETFEDELFEETMGPLYSFVKYNCEQQGRVLLVDPATNLNEILGSLITLFEVMQILLYEGDGLEAKDRDFSTPFSSLGIVTYYVYLAIIENEISFPEVIRLAEKKLR